MLRLPEITQHGMHQHSITNITLPCRADRPPGQRNSSIRVAVNVDQAFDWSNALRWWLLPKRPRIGHKPNKHIWPRTGKVPHQHTARAKPARHHPRRIHPKLRRSIRNHRRDIIKLYGTRTVRRTRPIGQIPRAVHPLQCNQRQTLGMHHLAQAPVPHHACRRATIPMRPNDRAHGCIHTFGQRDAIAAIPNHTVTICHTGMRHRGRNHCKNE